MKFGDKLRSLRESKKLTQPQLAEASATTQQSLSEWENGISIPVFDALQKVCKALGVSCAEFDDCDYTPVRKRGRGRPKKS